MCECVSTVLPPVAVLDAMQYYEELRQFHETLPRILRPGGVYSFFNGLAPDNIFFHMVYGR